MTIIQQKNLHYHLNFNQSKYKNQIYLLYGESILINMSIEKIIDSILGKKRNQFAIETFDADNNDTVKAFNSLRTFSLIESNKIIILRNIDSFNKKPDISILIDKIKKNYENKNIKESAKLLLTLLGYLNLKSLDNKSNINILRNLLTGKRKELWLQRFKDMIVSYNQEKSIIPERNNIDYYDHIINKKIPEKNYLIMTCASIDKGKSFLKTIDNKGLIIDCSIPIKETKGNKTKKKFIFDQIAKEIIEKTEKTIEKKAYNLLYKMSESNLSFFHNNLNKLISYVGKKKYITFEDVESIIDGNKKIFLFDLNNAIVDQDIITAISCLDYLLLKNIHPLQILVSILNNIKKLLLAKDFINNHKDKNWFPNLQFNQFELETIKYIKEYDIYTENMIKEYNETMKISQKSINKKYNEIFLLKNRNSYSVYMTLIKSNKLEKEVLLEGIIRIKEAEIKLKTTNCEYKNILESIIFFLSTPYNKN